MNVDVEIISRTAGILADQARIISLLNRGIENARFIMEFTAHVDICGHSAHRKTGDQTAFNQLVRVVAHDLPILAGARLGFIRVDDQIGRTPGIFFRHERPFEAGRKTRPATSAQPGFFHLVDDPVAALGENLLGPVPVSTRFCRIEAPVVEAIEIGENTILIAQHRDYSPAPVKVVGPPAGADF